VTRILPSPTPLSEPYWQGCRDGVLRLQHCTGCGRYQFYPRNLCSHCSGRELAWRDASGRGRVATFTVVRRGVSPAYEAPYIVALIDLAEGPRMMSWLVDTEPEDVVIGAPVTVDFEAWSDDVSMPVFRLEQEESES
jgi:uncharacterized OB-fold protein